jgi:hypothetical protein
MKLNLTSTVAIVAIVFGLAWYISRQKEHFKFLMPPRIKSGDRVMLTTFSGMYVIACNNCEPYSNINNKCSQVLCLRDEPYNTGIFTLHKHRDGRWSFETEYGKYWKRCEKCIFECDSAICADGINNNLRTHKFWIIKSPDRNGSIRIKSDNGRFLQTCPCTQTCGKVVCAKGLGGDIDFKVEILKTVPKEPPVLKFKPRWNNTSVPSGVLLSNLQ